MKKNEQNFLERWSRKKRGLEADADCPPVTLDECATAPEDGAEAGSDHLEGEPESEPKKDFADFDFEKLDYESDYTQFMGDDVTGEARIKALRKLWISNPVLANMDGLDDYCEDYTDAAVCPPKGLLKTAYRYGRGFLSDEEVAEWEALGKPEAEAVAENRAPDEDDAGTERGPSEGTVAEASSEPDADGGPGTACGVSVKQEEAEMLAEFEADDTHPAPDNS